MEIKLDNKDSLLTVFAFPVLGAAILLFAVWVGHHITREVPPTPVTITAASPKIDVNVPQAAAPRVEVTATAAQPSVEVNVPPSNPPAINITAPQPLVTIISRDPDKKDVTPVVPATSPSHSEATPASSAVQVVYKSKPEPVVFKNEDLTLVTLYRYAEKYIESYCAKNHLDPASERAKWNKEWQKRLETAVNDGSVSDENAFLNRVVVEKRDCLDLERATPEKVVEGCRLMLRYRDGNLTLLQAMQDQVTGENLRKSLVFLAAGVK